MSRVDEIIAGRAAVVARLETSDLYRSLGQAERDLKKWGQNIAKMGAVTFAAGAAGLALIKPAIQEFATAQQLFGRFDSVFGALNERAKTFSQTLATDVNQSVLTVQDSMAQFQAMFRGAGFDPEQSFRLAKWATKASQDLLAFDDNLTNVDEAVQKVRSGLMGEIQPVIAYGADVRVENAKRQAREYGIQVKGVMSIQDQLITRVGILDKAFTRSGIFGQAAREVNTLTARMRGLQAALRDLRVAVGATLEGTMTRTLAVMTYAIRGAIEFINANQGLVRSFVILSSIAIAVGAALFLIGGAAIVLGGLFGGLASAITAAPWAALQAVFFAISQVVRGQLTAALLTLWRAMTGGFAIARMAASHFLGIGRAILSLGIYAKAGLVAFGAIVASTFKLVGARLRAGDVKGAFRDLKDIIVAFTRVAVAEVKFWWTSFIGLFAGGSARINQIIQTMGNLLTAWWNRLIILLDVTGVLAPFITAWNWLKHVAIVSWDAIVQATQVAINWIRELVRDPLAAILRLWNVVKEGFITGWNAIVNTVVEVATSIGVWLADMWTNIAETAAAWWDYMVNYVVEAWMWATDRIAEILGRVLPILKDAYLAVRETVVGAFIIVTEYIAERWKALSDYLYDVFEPVINAISSAWAWLSNQFTQTIDLIQTAWTRFWSQSLTESILDFQEVAGQTFLYLWSLFDKTLDYEGAIGELALDYEQKREEARRRIAEEEARRKNRQNEINAQANAGVNAAREEARKRKAVAEAERKAAYKNLAGLRDWHEAQTRAVEGNLKKQEELRKQGVVPPTPPGQGPLGTGETEVSTGFVNSALQKAFGIGEDTAMDSIAANTADTAKNTAETNKKLDRLGPNVAP